MAIGLHVMFRGRRDDDAVDEAPGIFTCRGLSVPASAIRSTCAMTSPPELCAAIASASVSTVNASRSIVMLPSGSAVVPRMTRR